MIEGRCLCEAIRFAVEPPFRLFQYCHCSRCRKSTGAAYGCNLWVAPEQFRWLGGTELLGRYELPDAKYFATSFCQRCGSSLPWEVQGGANVVIPAGALDEDPGLLPEQNIHWASRAAWWVEAGDLVKHDALPPRRKVTKS